MSKYAHTGILERDGDVCLELYLTSYSLDAALNQKKNISDSEQLFDVPNVCIHPVVFDWCLGEEKEEQSHIFTFGFVNFQKGWLMEL